NGDIFSLELRLPYPSMEALGTWEQAQDLQGSIGILGKPHARFLESEFPGWRLKNMGISEAGAANAQPDGISFLYIDPYSLDEEEAATMGILLDNGGFRKTPCFVSARGMTRDQAEPIASLRLYLSRFVKIQASDTILYLGSSLGDGDEMPRGYRILHCHDPDALELLAGRESPRLLVLTGRSREFLAAIQEIPAFSTLPLLCIAAKFEDAAFEKQLAERPKTILCNSGEVFGDLVASCAKRLSRGEEFLPSPTGAIIMKAIIFLNRFFREQVSRWKLSEQVNASEDYLSRIFHRQMGIPLWEYLNRLRIGYAIELLKSRSDSVAEIASRSGFQDQAYFCRVFRRITGATPGAVRKESWPDVRKVQ
ncbi:MAG: AraC family transcriptional regulator, partial [Rectinemataceae bacterium]|nr:AraC family transcriptional regulator [Rectinemataceae bacterium]